MNLYLISQNDNTSYCSYEACVVLAKDEESARLVTPENRGFPPLCVSHEYLSCYNWSFSPNTVRVQYLGVAADYLGTKERVLLGHDSDIGASDELIDYLGFSSEV